MSQNAVVILTHFLNDHVRAMYQRLRAEAPADHKVFVHVFTPAPLPAPDLSAWDAPNHVILSTKDDFEALALGSGHMPADQNFLTFAATHPGYSQYWGIEYDVHYEGNWNILFERFRNSSSGLIATTVYQAALTPEKKFYDVPFHIPAGMQPAYDTAVRAMYPLFRMSEATLNAIISAYRSGLTGHYEIIWGMVAGMNGLGIEDFGGTGAFTKPENRNAFYFNCFRTHTLSPGTFVFRPKFGFIFKHKNVIWHPVKPGGIFIWDQDLVKKGSLPKRVLERIKPLVWLAVIWLWLTFKHRKI